MDDQLETKIKSFYCYKLKCELNSASKIEKIENLLDDVNYKFRYDSTAYPAQPKELSILINELVKSSVGRIFFDILKKELNINFFQLTIDYKQFKTSCSNNTHLLSAVAEDGEKSSAISLMMKASQITEIVSTMSDLLKIIFQEIIISTNNYKLRNGKINMLCDFFTIDSKNLIKFKSFTTTNQIAVNDRVRKKIHSIIWLICAWIDLECNEIFKNENFKYFKENLIRKKFLSHGNINEWIISLNDEEKILFLCPFSLWNSLKFKNEFLFEIENQTNNLKTEIKAVLLYIDETALPLSSSSENHQFSISFLEDLARVLLRFEEFNSFFLNFVLSGKVIPINLLKETGDLCNRNILDIVLNHISNQVNASYKSDSLFRLSVIVFGPVARKHYNSLPLNLKQKYIEHYVNSSRSNDALFAQTVRTIFENKIGLHINF